MTDPPAYLADVAPSEPRADAMPLVIERARLLDELERELDDLEERRRVVSKRINELQMVEIPDAMDQAGIDRLGVPGVGDIQLKPWYHATLPKEPQARIAAVSWLTQHGHADLIKTELSVAFTRGEHNLAGDVRAKLEHLLPDRVVDLQEDVHHMTYTKFIREQMEAGEALPLELLGARVGRVAQIKERKNG